MQSTFKAVDKFLERLLGLLIGDFPRERKRAEKRPRNLVQPVCVLLKSLPINRIRPILTVIPSNYCFHFISPNILIQQNPATLGIASIRSRQTIAIQTSKPTPSEDTILVSAFE